MLKLASYLFEMGCPINIKKSVLVPQPAVTYLGLKVTLDPLNVSIPQEKLAKLASFHELIRDLPIVSSLKGY